MPLADAVVVLLPTGGVGDRQPLHERGQFLALFGPEHKVPVIRHQAVGENADWGFVERLAEDFLEGGVVVFVMKERLPIDASIENVERHSGRCGASVSRHVHKYIKFTKPGNWT